MINEIFLFWLHFENDFQRSRWLRGHNNDTKRKPLLPVHLGLKKSLLSKKISWHCPFNPNKWTWYSGGPEGFDQSEKQKFRPLKNVHEYFAQFRLSAPGLISNLSKKKLNVCHCTKRNIFIPAVCEVTGNIAMRLVNFRFLQGTAPLL